MFQTPATNFVSELGKKLCEKEFFFPHCIQHFENALSVKEAIYN